MSGERDDDRAAVHQLDRDLLRLARSSARAIRDVAALASPWARELVADLCDDLARDVADGRRAVTRRDVLLDQLLHGLGRDRGDK